MRPHVPAKAMRPESIDRWHSGRAPTSLEEKRLREIEKRVGVVTVSAVIPEVRYDEHTQRRQPPSRTVSAFEKADDRDRRESSPRTVDRSARLDGVRRARRGNSSSQAQESRRAST